MSETATENLEAIQRVLEDTGFELVNAEKVGRVVEGILGKDGHLTGGVGNDAASELILAHYDRAGGLIRKNGDIVRTGSFYDFKAKVPRKKPQVEFVFRVNGREVYVPEGTELPGEVRAARLLAAQDAEVAAADEKPKRKKK